MTTYTLQEAVDLLDAIATGEVPGADVIIHGAVALAVCGPRDHPDFVDVIGELEQLGLGRVEELPPEALERAARLATSLRRAIGVH
jgi:hypothetical protein